jgi:uncharacterized membrane protein YcaP (DUF421 family)
LRLQNVESPADVRLATLENNGRISVVPRKAGAAQQAHTA